MQVHIWLDEQDPPAGRLAFFDAAGGSPMETSDQQTARVTPFVGWLGLMRALSEAVASADGKVATG